MNEEQNIFELIEKYHQGLLSEEEKTLVEKRMQDDAAFAEYVHINGMAGEVVYTSGIDMLREQMTKDLKIIDRKRTIKKYGIGAGVIVLLVALSSVIYFTKQTLKKKVSIQNVPSVKVSIDSLSNETTVPSAIISGKNSTNINPIEEKVEAKQIVDTTNANSIIYAPSTKTDITAHTSIPMVNEKVETINQAKVKEASKPNCNLSFDVTVKTTCKGEAKGSIMVDQKSIMGGEAPYSFRISSSSKENTIGSFPDLVEGNYTVSIYDSRSCSYSKEVVVFGTMCNEKKSYSFNPDYGEVWKIPYVEGTVGSFTLYNRAGMTIYKGSFSKFDKVEWIGTNLQGAIVDSGLYICVIEYSTGEIEKIEISVVR